MIMEMVVMMVLEKGVVDELVCLDNKLFRKASPFHKRIVLNKRLQSTIKMTLLKSPVIIPYKSFKNLYNCLSQKTIKELILLDCEMIEAKYDRDRPYPESVLSDLFYQLCILPLLYRHEKKAVWKKRRCFLYNKHFKCIKMMDYIENEYGPKHVVDLVQNDFIDLT